MRLNANQAYQGSFVQTAWSSKVAILEVLYSFRTSHQTIFGVRAETLDQKSDHHGLLWVRKDSRGFQLWQECRQRPYIIDGESDYEIEEILGHYETESGTVYYAVKWIDYECPTWELEDDLWSCRLITSYCLHLTQLTQE
jgi:hypothetical protein